MLLAHRKHFEPDWMVTSTNTTTIVTVMVLVVMRMMTMMICIHVHIHMHTYKVENKKVKTCMVFLLEAGSHTDERRVPYQRGRQLILMSLKNGREDKKVRSMFSNASFFLKIHTIKMTGSAAVKCKNLFCFLCILFSPRYSSDCLWTMKGAELTYHSMNSQVRENIKKQNIPVSKNRHILKYLIPCVKFCCLFELPLRGHDESALSTTILTELVTDIGDKAYSLIIDESTDVSVMKYHMALCVKYYSDILKTITTDFLGFVEAHSATANAVQMCEAAPEFISSVGLKIENNVELALMNIAKYTEGKKNFQLHMRKPVTQDSVLPSRQFAMPHVHHINWHQCALSAQCCVACSVVRKQGSAE
ncbi:hypothetical protein PR048_008593 [Dryococelus australis]|uniref:DUF4371 domain-containing protein n=1 Tax=Dryococelus australis TaxID=614101 RepID=A0ABQ9HXJ8_9NEOP|nr:hypothetical protein PR048_008593 [Dryococelus australis]